MAKVKRKNLRFETRDFALLGALHLVKESLESLAVSYHPRYPSNEIEALFEVIKEKKMPGDFQILLLNRLGQISKRQLASKRDTRRIKLFLETMPL